MTSDATNTDTAERRPRRRNAGVGDLVGQHQPVQTDETELRRLAARLGEVDSIYAERDALVIKMYDHGYTHRQLAELMNDAAGTELTYDAVGRIIRNARKNGIDV
jgi:hypothetical protein